MNRLQAGIDEIKQQRHEMVADHATRIGDRAGSDDRKHIHQAHQRLTLS
jgi:hypothetical protein